MIETAEKCGIKHGFSDAVCRKPKGHRGACESKAYRGTGGTITYSKWESRDGVFYRHMSYETIYAKNSANRPK